jgi:hypothetical protein
MKTYNGNIVQRKEGDFYAEVWVEGNLLSYPLSKPVVEAKGNVDFQLIGGEAVVVNHINYKIEEYLFDWIASSGSYNPPFQTEDLVEFAGYCIEQNEKDQYQPILFNTDWPQVNTTLLVNFLRMPVEPQKSLIEGMMARKPELFVATNYWEQRCELAEKYMAAFDSESALFHKKEYQEFIKNNKQP